MKRAISALVLLALVAMLAVSGFCETTAVRVGALTGPTAMGMAQLLDEPEYTPTIVGAADELMPRILQGEVDIAAVPANLAATLYQKTQGGVTVLAVNVLGVLYVGELDRGGLKGEDPACHRQGCHAGIFPALHPDPERA